MMILKNEKVKLSSIFKCDLLKNIKWKTYDYVSYSEKVYREIDININSKIKIDTKKNGNYS